jgi:Putative mono-oxygenase ydhR
MWSLTDKGIFKMPLKLLQINFSYNGPWGNDMAQAYTELAQTISETPGLLWKIWIENSNAQETGGIYLFDDEASLDSFLKEHTASLNSFGIEDINVKKFDVNEPLTEITRGKFG